MMRLFAFASLLLAAVIGTVVPAFAEPPAKPRALPTEARTWKGDFDGMIARRHVRVLVPYSRTL